MEEIRELVAKIDSARGGADLVSLTMDVQNAVSVARCPPQQARRPAANGVDANAFDLSMKNMSTTFCRLSSRTRKTFVSSRRQTQVYIRYSFICLQLVI